MRARLDQARANGRRRHRTARPAVELVRGLPFAGTGYLWPDAEGITSNLVMLAANVAAEFAGHAPRDGRRGGRVLGDRPRVPVLAGQEALIGLRCAPSRAGDWPACASSGILRGLIDADRWSDGEPAPKLVGLRKELLAH